MNGFQKSIVSLFISTLFYVPASAMEKEQNRETLGNNSTAPEVRQQHADRLSYFMADKEEELLYNPLTNGPLDNGAMNPLGRRAALEDADGPVFPHTDVQVLEEYADLLEGDEGLEAVLMQYPHLEVILDAFNDNQLMHLESNNNL